MTTITKPPAIRGTTLGGRPRRPLLHERAAPAVRQVLVVDVCNLGLGAMTAALLDHHGDGRVRARAVGTDAVVRTDPSLRWVMAEAGVPIPTELHGCTSAAAMRAADVVVAVGPRVWAPGVDGPVQDWIIDAPVHGDMQPLRCLRDALTRRVLRLLLQLSVDLGPQRARFLTGGPLG
jgi:hypothetical protein